MFATLKFHLRNRNFKFAVNPLIANLKPQSKGTQDGDRYTGRWREGCYICYTEEGSGRAAAPPSPLLAVPNVIAHPATASVPTILFDVAL